jgi:hypothetical protein
MRVVIVQRPPGPRRQPQAEWLLARCVTVTVTRGLGETVTVRVNHRVWHLEHCKGTVTVSGQV